MFFKIDNFEMQDDKMIKLKFGKIFGGYFFIKELKCH